MKIQFHVGDRVVGNGVEDGLDVSGLHGVIVRELYSGRLSVNWDEFRPEFHGCGGRVPLGHGWNCSPEILLLDEEYYALDGVQLPEPSLLLM